VRPAFKGSPDRLVEVDQPVVDGRGRDDAPKALRPAEQRVRRLRVVALAVALEDDAVIANGEQRVQLVARSVGRGLVVREVVR